MEDLEDEGSLSPTTLSFTRRCHGLEKSDEHLHIIATPLLEVFSVNINITNNEYMLDDGAAAAAAACNIWGLINVLDKDDKPVSEVYRRNKKDPDMVLPGGLISLTSPDYRPIVPCTGYKMRVFLMDGSRNLANESFSLNDTTSPNDFEKMKVAKVRGEDGYAVVRYATFQAAVMATIEELKVISRVAGVHQRFSDHGNICATIVARYGNYHGYPSNDAALNDHSCVLLDNQVVDKSIKVVELETPITLSKSRVVVPAYSSLVLETRFWDKSTKHNVAHASITLEALEIGCAFGNVELQTSSMEDDVQGFLFQDCDLDLRVRWYNMYEIARETHSLSMESDSERNPALKATRVFLMRSNVKVNPALMKRRIPKSADSILTSHRNLSYLGLPPVLRN